MAEIEGGGAGGPQLTSPRTAVDLDPRTPAPPITSSPYRNISTPQIALPSSVPIVPVAGVSVADLVDSFGASRDGGKRSHKGIDIFAPENTPVLSTVSGRVIAAGSSGGKAGLRVWVEGDDGRYHFFAHLSMVHVQQGMRVGAGQVLGRVGDTGNAQGTPPHLHYSVNSKPMAETGDVNPYLYLKTGYAADPSTLSYSTSPWVPADLSLPSDDDGPLEDLPPQRTYRDAFRDTLMAMSAIFAGGQITDPALFPVPIDTVPEGDQAGGQVQAASAQQGAGSGVQSAPQPFTPGDTGNPDRDFIINRENDAWDPTIWNRSGSSAFGLGQIKDDPDAPNRSRYGEMLGIDPNTTDPWEQIALMDAYVEDRYGSYEAARAHHEQNGWY